MKVIVKKVGNSPEIVDVDFRYRGECAALLDGDGITAEYVTVIDRELSMMVDEEGLIKGLPLNFFVEMNNPFYPVQAIVGTVVFCRFRWENPWEKELWDFELLDVTEGDLQVVEQMLNREDQVALKARYLSIGE